MPSVTAKRQCPDLIFVKPRFEVYKAVSQQIREIFAEHTPSIEPLSLDEAYLDVTENLQRIPIATEIALEIRRRIKAETGLTASAGISYNKFLAKLASDHNKPNGAVRHHAKDGTELRRDAAHRQISRRRPGHGRPDERARHLTWSAIRPSRFSGELRQGGLVLFTPFRAASTTARSAPTG